MAGVTDSVEKWNAREQLLSADLMRGQFIGSRDIQNREAARSRSFDCSDPSSPSSQVEMLSVLGSPIYGVDKAPTWNPTAGYAVDIGAGDGFIDNPSLAGLTSDDSSYLVVRWPTTNVTFANPPGANQRIDVVIATPAMADADSQSRTVLVDPVTRAISTSNLFKSSNPTAALSIVQGVAGASPAPPAIPAGALPLFYVWIKNGDATAGNFGATRASYRRAPYPFNSMSGVVSGMGLKWGLSTNAASAVAPMIAKGFHRIVIDGELMEFTANMDSTVGSVQPDTSNNPFGVAAPVGVFKPYYIYAVGGRHNPRPSYNTADGLLSPVTIVESLTPPNIATGKPTATMTVGGQTIAKDGAVYVGVGFVFPNTTNRAPLSMNNEMVYSPVRLETVSVTIGGVGFHQLGPFASAPAPSTTARLNLSFAVANTGAARSVIVCMDDSSGAAVVPNVGFTDQMAGISGQAINTTKVESGQWVHWQAGQPATVWAKTGQADADTISLNIIGYSHGVNRIGLHVNP